MSDETVSSDKAVSDQTVAGVDNGSGVDGVDQGSGVDSVDQGSSVVDSVDGADGGSRGVSSSRGRGVLGLSGVGHLLHVSEDVVSVVVHGLDPAVGEVDRVGSLNSTGAIVGLGLAEGGLGVVVSDSVGVGVGGGLGQVTSGVAGSVDHGGSGVLGGGAGGGHKGKSNEGLKKSILTSIQ